MNASQSYWRWILHRLISLPKPLIYKLKGLNISLKTYLSISPNCQYVVGNHHHISGRVFKIEEHSSVKIGDKATIEGYFSIGKNSSVVLGKHFRLKKGANFIIGDDCHVSIGDDCLIEAVSPYSAQVNIEKGSFRVGKNVSFRGNVYVKKGDLEIGSNTFLNEGSEIRCEHLIQIGSYVFISYLVDIFDTNTHSLDWQERLIEVERGYPNKTIQDDKYESDTAPLYIGDNVWVGKLAAILKGSSVGSRSIVGTRAVVTKQFQEEHIIVGNPAKSQKLAGFKSRMEI